MNISPSSNYSAWKFYDTDTRMDTKGNAAHFASAGFDAARLGRDVIDLVNPVSEFTPFAALVKNANQSVWSGLALVLFGVPVFLIGVVTTAVKFVVLPFYMAKDISDILVHIAIGAAQVIIGKKEGAVVDKSLTANAAPFDFWTPDTWQPFTDEGRAAPVYDVPDPPVSAATSTAPQNALAAPSGASVRTR